MADTACHGCSNPRIQRTNQTGSSYFFYETIQDGSIRAVEIPKASRFGLQKPQVAKIIQTHSKRGSNLAVVLEVLSFWQGAV